ncbi:hypothetical protein GCM10027450_11560 [Pseudidiomarina andamanensis]
MTNNRLPVRSLIGSLTNAVILRVLNQEKQAENRKNKRFTGAWRNFMHFIQFHFLGKKYPYES